MAYVDFWVYVDISDDGKTGTWFGRKQRVLPNEKDDNDERHVWIRLQEDDVIWIIESWDFSKGPLPKQYRGLAPTHFSYDFKTKTWSNVTIEMITWQQIKDERMAKLTDTDWVIIKYTELGQPIPQEWLDYRQFLRDYPETYKNLSAEHAQHILNFTFDPETKKRRLEKGLFIEPPEWNGEE